MCLKYYFDNIEYMKQSEIVSCLAALAQESRLALFRLLVKRGPEGYSAGDLASRLDVAGPTLSFHLKELQRAGLVFVRRDGRFRFYSANFERMQGLVGFLTDNCCSLSAVACDASCRPLRGAARKSA